LTTPSTAIVSLRSGRVGFKSPPLLPFATTDTTFDTIRRIVVDDRGGVAWIARRGGGGTTPVIEVRRRLGRSKSVSEVVASDPAIEPDSLRRVGHRISWRKGGETFTAAL